MKRSSKIEESKNYAESIERLPTVKKLRSGIAGYGVLGRLIRDDALQEESQRLNNELDEIIGVIERFYSVLGGRNWAFSASFELNRICAVLDCQTVEESESSLIAYLKESGVLDGMILRLNRFPDIRTRLNLLNKAKVDYIDGRYYSSVFVVISVMDGFVNDLFKNERRGLHARASEEMYAEDCFSAIWAGLPSIQEVFTKSVRKRIDEPIFDVMRHAIMHGMATDFDNEIVASKAWCMLFAIADWADAKTTSLNDRELEASSTFGLQLLEMRKTAVRNANTKKRFNEWGKHRVDMNDPMDGDIEIIQSCSDYLAA